MDWARTDLSRQNTNTGKLTEAMLDKAFAEAKKRVETS